MPGSGKSYWAKALSKEYHTLCLDTDILIEESERKSVNEIFDQYGEDYFRKAEHEIIKTIAENTGNAIVSVGGGAPCFYDNMQWMNDHGTTIYLKAATKYLVKNLKNDVTLRPLLKDEQAGLDSKIEALLSARKKYYEQADYIVDAEQLSLNTFAAILNRHV